MLVKFPISTPDWDYLSPSTTYYPAGHVEDLVQDTSLHSNILEHAQLRLQLRNLQDQIWAKVDMLDYRISNSINDELDRISKIILENKKNIKNGTRKHDEIVQILEVEIADGFLSASESQDLLMNDVEDLRHTNTINKSQMDLEIRMDKEKARGEMQSQSETVDTIITMMKIVPKLANPYTALGAASDLAIQTALNAVKGVGGGSGKSTGKKG
jgi:hypothetical protein